MDVEKLAEGRKRFEAAKIEITLAMADLRAVLSLMPPYDNIRGHMDSISKSAQSIIDIIDGKEKKTGQQRKPNHEMPIFAPTTGPGSEGRQ